MIVRLEIEIEEMLKLFC